MADFFDAAFAVGPAVLHTSLHDWRVIWRKCRDVLAGEERVKFAHTAYLPKMQRMSDDEYEAYKTRALFYGASQRTLQGLLGSLLRKPPVIYAKDDLIVDKINKLLENVTQTDVDFYGFTRDVITELLSVGRVGILVDAPPVDTKLLDPRPYARIYQAETIINWREHFEDGVPILDQVVLVEQISQPAGSGFGTDMVTQYRELALQDDGTYTQRVWVIDPPADEKLEATYRIIEEIVPLFRGKPLRRLPFFFVASSHTRPEIERPPLLDLYNVNLSHYRSSADLEHGRHFTALPTPVVSGVDTDPDSGAAPPSLEIGSSTAWLLPLGATAQMLEFNGQGLKHLENALTEKTALMVSLGARMLEQTQRHSETAEALRLRQAGDFATLNTISETTSQALTNVVRLLAWWSGLTDVLLDDTLLVQLNKDYFESRLTPAMLTSLVQAWQAGAMGFRDLYFNLIRGETIDPERTYDEVFQEVKAETVLRQASVDAGANSTNPRVQQGKGSATQA